MSEEILNRYINDNSDSLTVGTPGKGGEIKVYGSADRPDEFKEKIKRMVELRAFAGELLGD